MSKRLGSVFFALLLAPACVGADPFDAGSLASVSAVDVAAASLRATTLKVELAASTPLHRDSQEEARATLARREAAEEALAARRPDVRTLF